MIFPLVLLLAFADLAHFGRTLYPLADPTALFPVTPNVAAVRADADVRAHQARVLAPSAGVWLRFTNYKDYGQNIPDYQTLWADTLTPNLTMPYGLLNAYGYEPVTLKSVEATAGRTDHAFDPQATAADRANAAAWAGTLGVKYVADCRVRPPEETLPGLSPFRTDPTLAPTGKKMREAAFVYLSRNNAWQPRARLEGSGVPITLHDDGPDTVRLKCVSDGPARLLLADTPAPGWGATVDGVPAPIETVGGSLRAVRLPQAGPHVVVFAYRPTAFRLGLYLSLLILAALIGAASFGAARNLRGRGGFRPPGGE